MKRISNILVPLDGSPTALKSLAPATWLASHLNARVHVLNAGPPLPQEQILARLGVAEKYRHLIEVHQLSQAAPTAILAAVQDYHVGLIVMTARGESALSTVTEATSEPALVGSVTREVIERSPVPVLVLPPAYVTFVPWRSVLVPLSGEPATDESLTLALQLAHRLQLSVTVAHVANHMLEGEVPGGRYADQMHHEFAQMFEQLVANVCSTCTDEERNRIEAFHVTRGDIGEELMNVINRKSISLLVVGWHGEFMIGHAKVLKRLIREIRCPVLLVKPAPKAPFRLKVGEALEE